MKKFGRSRRNKVAFFLFFFVFVYLCCYKFDRHCRREKNVQSAQNWNNSFQSSSTHVKPMVLANTLGKEVPKFSSTQSSSWQSPVIPCFPSLFFFFLKLRSVGQHSWISIEEQNGGKWSTMQILVLSSLIG